METGACPVVPSSKKSNPDQDLLQAAEDEWGMSQFPAQRQQQQLTLQQSALLLYARCMGL